MGHCLQQSYPGGGGNDFGFYETGSDCYVRNSSCFCIPWPCANVKFCGTRAPQWYLSCHSYFCGSCAQFDFGNMEFKDNIDDEWCPVCLEHPEYFVKFPACTHYFCKNCTRDIIYWDETRYHLSPVPYGCPPCPNGCDNPIRGRQCCCIEYWNSEEEEGELGIIQQWEQECPEQYKEYNDAELLSIENSIENTSGSAWASGKCPLCRASIRNEN